MIVWETRKPYESVLESSAAGVLVKGLRLRHSSPSVANNIGVFMRGGSLKLEVRPRPLVALFFSFLQSQCLPMGSRTQNPASLLPEPGCHGRSPMCKFASAVQLSSQVCCFS